MKKIKKNMVRLFSLLITGVVLLGCAVPAAAANESVKLEGYENKTTVAMSKLGSYVSGYSNKDGGVAEIVSYDSANNKAWVVNGATGKLDILDLSDITCAVSDEIRAETLDIRSMVNSVSGDFVYGDMTSVSVNSELGIAAVALQHAEFDKNGCIALLDTDGELICLIDAGCQPDMVTFTPDGTKILSANEGEPREGIGDGFTDPCGSVTVISVNKNNITKSTAVTVGFEKFDAEANELTESGVMIAKGTVPSTDFEPEYIAATDSFAYVTLQEANAVAVLDLSTNEFDGVYSLGYKDLGLEKNAVDLISDEKYEAKTYSEAVGAYMPDGISVYTCASGTYILTANEGDAREWGDYVNEIKVTLTSDDAAKAKKVRAVDPELVDGMPEGKTVLFGGRSYSVYRVESNGLVQIFDSGNDFEAKTVEYIPEFFNCSNDDNEYDSRSQKKGPEPESVTVGTVDGRTYAFVALERIGGIMVYDITDPENISYCNYINTRDFSEDPGEDVNLTGDIAPEGLCFVSAENSPSGTPLLMGAFEVSGTVAAYSVGKMPAGHTYASEWSCDDSFHWHEAACSHGVGVSDKAEHEFVGNVCVSCGYEKPAEDTSVPNFGDETSVSAGGTESGSAESYETDAGVTDAEKPVKSPQTGDDIGVALVMVCVSFIGMGVVISVRRYGRNEM